MEIPYTYIIAPHVDNNYTILSGYMQQFPEVLEEQRVKMIFKKDPDDLLSGEGDLLVAANPLQYILVKAEDSKFDPSMLDGVTDASTYTVDTLPTDIYWI